MITQIILGREPQNKEGNYYRITIKDLDELISKEHAEITIINENTFLIEDLSLNGTFINGWKIKKAIFSFNDELKLAHKKINFKKEYEEAINKKIKYSDFTPEFNVLKVVYNEYEKNTKKIKRKDTLRAGGIKFLVMISVYFSLFILSKYIDKKDDLYISKLFGNNASSEIISSRCTLVNELAVAKDTDKIQNVFLKVAPNIETNTIIKNCAEIKTLKENNGNLSNILHLIGGAAALCLAIIIKPKGSDKQLATLKTRFESTYTCPKCKNYLGNNSWQEFAEQNRCPRCKKSFNRY